LFKFFLGVEIDEDNLWFECSDPSQNKVLNTVGLSPSLSHLAIIPKYLKIYIKKSCPDRLPGIKDKLYLSILREAAYTSYKKFRIHQ